MQVKEKLIIRLIGIFLCVILCVVSFMLTKHTEENRLWREKYALQEINNNTFHEVLNRNMKSVINTDGIMMNGKTHLRKIYHNKRDSFPVALLTNKLSLFVPAKSCNVCYDEIYDALKYAQDSLGLEYSIITEKDKYNEVRNIVMDLGISIKENTYYLEDSIFWNSISVAYAPFLSYIDENLKCCHSFVPFPNHPQYSYHYLKLLWNRYFNESKIMESK